MLSIIVVAAGMSRRMGTENKLILPFNGKPLFRHLLDEVLKLKSFEIIVVTGHQSEQIESFIPESNIEIVRNENYESGLTSSIQAGVHASQNGHDFMICLSDMPFVEKTDLRLIIDYFYQQEKSSIVIPKFKNKQSHPIVFSNEYKLEILNHKAPDGCKGIIKKHFNKVCFLNVHRDFSIDIDTPEAYRNWNEGNQ